MRWRLIRARQISAILIAGLFILIANTTAAEDKLVVAVPDNLPPWTFKESDSGITPDLIRAAFRDAAIEIAFRYVPLARLTVSMSMHDVDAVAMVQGNKVMGPFYYSDDTAYFQTSLISLKSSQYQINSIEDLFDKRLVVFQDASVVFPSIKKIMENNPKYREIPKQDAQVTMLYLKRADLILIDRKIFRYWESQIDSRNPNSALRDDGGINVQQYLRFHDLSAFDDIEERSAMKTVFRFEKHQAQFNKGLQKIRQNGEWDKIIKRYDP